MARRLVTSPVTSRDGDYDVMLVTSQYSVGALNANSSKTDKATDCKFKARLCRPVRT